MRKIGVDIYKMINNLGNIHEL